MNVAGATPGPDGRSRRWDDHRDRRRDEIITAATTVIDVHGPGAGLDVIAAAAGTSKPVLYRYFADKSDLHRAVGERVADRVAAALVDVHARRGGTADPRAQLRRAVEVSVDLLGEHPGLFRLLAGAGRDGGRADLLTRALAGPLRRCGLDPLAASPWGEGAVGLIRASCLWWLDHPGALTREQLADRLTAQLWGGAAGVLGTAGP